MNVRHHDQAEVVVIGAGIGGLCAAIRAASAGHDVAVFEAGDGPGGKAGIATHDGVRFDTGPSVLTLPGVFDEVLLHAGLRLADVVTLVEPEPAFRYLWADGARFDVHTDLDATIDSAAGAFGDDAAAQLRRFLDHARGIWDAAAPAFVFGEAPTAGRVLRMGPRAIRDLMRIDAMRSMQRAIEAFVTEPHLRDVLARYATYNGSDPRVAPATLNCIAWVELGLGGFGVRGGLYALVEALESVAKSLGVRFVYGRPVERILTDADGVAAIEVAGRLVRTRTVIANADVAHLADALLAEPPPAVAAPAEPSMSGWTAVARARRRDDRAAHTVLFATPYAEEFADIFDRGRAPRVPTVYLCAQEKAHGASGWADHEPVFVMANAPAEPDGGATDPMVFAALADATLGRARAAGLLDGDDRVVWTRTPAGLASRFPGTRGAIYGASSNDRFAAFKRPPNRVAAVPGLYLASGSAHPGGGLPLCASSGRVAAESALADGVRGPVS